MADRGLTATGPTDRADSRASPRPAQHYGGHCRTFCEQASPSVGEVWSNKSADGCGRCLEVINRSVVWVWTHPSTGRTKTHVKMEAALFWPCHRTPHTCTQTKSPSGKNLSNRPLNQVITVGRCEVVHCCYLFNNVVKLWMSFLSFLYVFFKGGIVWLHWTGDYKETGNWMTERRGIMCSRHSNLCLYCLQLFLFCGKQQFH